MKYKSWGRQRSVWRVFGYFRRNSGTAATLPRDRITSGRDKKDHFSRLGSGSSILPCVAEECLRCVTEPVGCWLMKVWHSGTLTGHRDPYRALTESWRQTRQCQGGDRGRQTIGGGGRQTKGSRGEACTPTHTRTQTDTWRLCFTPFFLCSVYH